MRRSVILAAVLAVMSATASAGIVNLIDDQDLPTANWSVTTIDNFGGFSGSAGQSAAGGNPGAYRSISHSSVSGNAAGHLEHLHVTTWTPSVDGAIVSLDMGVDVDCFNGGTSNAVAFGLIIVQGGVTYFGPTYTPVTNSGWRTDLRMSGLTAADFDNSGAPDFSSTGGTLQFGFYSSNGTASGTPISSTSGADNFYVVLNAAPEPATVSVLGLMGLAMLRRGGRRWVSE
jgi:hypothetical protein